MKTIFRLFFVLIGLMGSMSTSAHDLNFGVLEISDRGAGQYTFEFRFTSKELDLSGLELKLPAFCNQQKQSVASKFYSEQKYSWVVFCDATQLEKKAPNIVVAGIQENQSLFVRYMPIKGDTIEKVNRGNFIPLADIVEAQLNGDATSSVFGYFDLGFEHILEGYDHLLVVLCFLLLFSKVSTVLWVVTGFTAGHSLSLILATWFGWNIPAELVETFIVLSVVFMARESFVGAKTTLVGRFPVIMSMLIGLLHGLGFANVINELGLPSENTLPAILMFNLGVEFGQLLFVLVGLLSLYLLTKLVSYRQAIIKLISLGIGTTSVFWLIQLA